MLESVYRFFGANSDRIRDAAQRALFTVASRQRTRLAGIGGALKAQSSRNAIVSITILAIAMVIILTIAANSLGLWTAVVTGVVFFWPLLTGGFAAVHALARLEQDGQIATDRAETAQKLASSHTPIDKDSLRRFEPANAGATTISARVVKRVVLACTEGRYEPVASILALDLPAIRAGSNKVRKAQLFAIRLGILTTFIGLMLCLYHIVPLLENVDIHNKATVINKPVQEMANVDIHNKTAMIKLVQEMAMAFGGSVAGLLAATLLQMLSGITENHESDLLKRIETAILAVQTYFYNAISREPLIRSMEALGNSIKSFNKSLDEGRVEIDRAANHVTLQIRSQDDILRARQDEMAKGRDAFAELVTSQTQAIATLEQTLRHAAERVAADIRTWVDAQVQIAAANALATGVAEGKTALANHARAVEHSLAEANRASLNLLEQVNTVLARTDRVQRDIRTAIIIGMVTLTVTGFGQLGLLAWLILWH